MCGEEVQGSGGWKRKAFEEEVLVCVTEHRFRTLPA